MSVLDIDVDVDVAGVMESDGAVGSVGGGGVCIMELESVDMLLIASCAKAADVNTHVVIAVKAMSVVLCISDAPFVSMCVVVFVLTSVDRHCRFGNDYLSSAPATDAICSVSVNRGLHAICEYRHLRFCKKCKK